MSMPQYKQGTSIRKAYLIVGPINAGKDTTTEHIKSKYGYVNVKLAEPIKYIGKFLFGWDERHTEGKLKEVVDPNFGISPRQFLQVMGTDWMQHSLNDKFKGFRATMNRLFWVKRLVHATSLNHVVVSDVRFPHEVDYFRSTVEDVVVIRVKREGTTPKVGFFGRLFGIGKAHSSETEMGAIKADYTIENDGTLEELYDKINVIMEETK